MRMASLTGRSPEASEGLLTNLFLMTMVVEPPPSRLIASVAPNSISRSASMLSDMPMLSPGWRPSTARSRICPDLSLAIAVRGCPSLTKPGRIFSAALVISMRPFLINCGGPQLIKNGRIEITNAAEKILPGFVSDGHPRTAIAKLKSGQILLLAVDGRQPGESIGMSLNMLADLLIEFGATEAINLDGGGSTTMVIRNKLVNKPSDASGERPVSDAILIYPR